VKRTETGVLFGTWLRSVRAREREAGVDHRELACYASKLTPYIQDNLSEALHRLEKLYIQIPATAFTEQIQRERWEKLRPGYVRDVREALDFLAATLTAVGCTEDELESVNRPSADPEGNDDPSEGCADNEDFSSEETTQIPIPRDEGEVVEEEVEVAR
jgi:hypothetical protein